MNSCFSILVFCIVLLFCTFSSSCTRQKSTSNIIRLGYLQNDLHHLPAFVALEKKFFNNEGIKVQVAGVFKAGPELMSAFGSGDLDLGYVGQAPATAAVLNNVADVRFIAQVNREGSSLIVRKENSALSIADLAGASVAIPGHATMQDFLLRRAVENSGTSFDKLKIIVLKPPEMLQALSQQQIEAFIAWEPYPTQAVANGTGRLLLSSSQIWPGHPCCVLVVSANIYRTNPEIIGKILSAHRRACVFIKQNPEAAAEIGVRYTGMSVDTIRAALAKIDFTPELDRATSGEFVAFLKQVRYIQSRAPEKPLSEFLPE